MSTYIHYELLYNSYPMDVQMKLCYTRVYVYVVEAKFISYTFLIQ